MKKIYDCFLFFNELEILELRMNILNDVVDYFVIVESTKTFSSKPKNLFYGDNESLFEKFKDKIIHVIIDDTPVNFININYITNPKTEGEILNNKILKYVDESPGWSRHETQWGVETYQRECILKGLINCNDDDIIIVSDVDEIPNPDELIKIKENFNNEDIIEFKQNMYYYYFNVLKETDWSGPKLCSFKYIKDIALNGLRQNKHTNKVISNGGWHFSFMGGEEKIVEKLEAYAHQEYNTSFYKENIVKNITSNSDLFFRGGLTQVELDETYPKYLLDNLDKYKHMLK
jgi:beta-1,4-mannosyl-glycoprotein beta-1,4-N-acetylglucosaminyltransferase